VHYAVQRKADALILCGDTFKDVNPSSTLLKMFANRLHKLTSEGIQVLMLLGNHDSPKTIGRAAPPEVFEELRLTGLYVFSEPSFIDLHSSDGSKLRIFALPYRHPIHIAAKVEEVGAEKVGLDRNKLLLAFQEEIKRNIEIFTKAGKKDAQIGILAAHLFVEGARRGAERIYIVGEEFAIPPSMLESHAFDFVALGHVHSHQTIRGKVPIVYAGSLERIDFSEADEQKGFVEIVYENRSLEWKFIPIETRRMVKLRVDCTSVESPDKLVADKINEAQIEDAIVRLILTVRPGIQVDLNLIRERLAPSFWYQVSFERILEKVASTSQWESLNPHGTLTRYLKTLKLSKEDIELVEKLGHEIIAEVLAETEET
jgi:exonuclease SbcD